MVGLHTQEELERLVEEARDTVDNCYACNGGVTIDPDWPEGRCPICGHLRAALQPFDPDREPQSFDPGK